MGTSEHPWRALRAHDDWCYYVADLPPGVVAATRWEDRTIWLRPGLSQVERRCAIAHELEHVARGMPGLWAKDERAVRQATARKLVSLDALVDVARWTHDLDEAAAELWVTPGVLRTRLRHLHPSEGRALRAALGHDEPDHTNTTQGEHP